MSRTIGAILNLKDLFSPKIQQTTNKTREFQRELKHAQNTVGGLKKSVTSHFTSMASSIKGFGLGLVSGMNFSSMIASAKKGQQATAQLTTVLKSTKDAVGMTKQQLIDLAAAQSRETTFTKGQIIGGENLLLTFTKIGKKTFPDTIKAAENMSTVMGTSLNSSVMMLGKALNDPAAGLSKLTRSGVTFTDQQKKQITAMQKAGNVAGAQKLMLQELNKEFGGSAKAAGQTYTGTITRIKNTLTGLGGTIGSQLVPYMSKFADNLVSATPAITAAITTVVKTASPFIAGIVKDVGSIIKNLIPSLNGSTKSMQSTLSTLISGGLGAVKDVFDWIANHGTVVRMAIIGISTAFAGFKIAGGISTTIKQIKNIKSTIDTFKKLKKEGSILSTLFKMPIATPIILGITAIAMAVYLIVTHWKQIKTFFAGLGTWFKQKITGFWTWLRGFMNTWGGVILTVLFPVLGIPLQIITHWKQIKIFFINLGASIKVTFNSVVNWFATLPAKLGTHGRNMFTSFKAGAWSVISGIGAWIGAKFSAFINFFKNLPHNALQWGKDIINQLKAGIHAKVASVVAEAKSLGKKILDGIKNIFGIHSPSKEMFKIGGYLVKGLENGIFKGKGALKSVVSKIFGGTLDLAKGIFGGGGGDVSSWLTAALGITGQSMSNLPALMKIAMHESGGNPRAINLWDSNAKAGHPSKGLMQTIDSTFNSYKMPGLGDIYNPIANAVASIRYMVARYGSISNVPGVRSSGYVGYWTGTNNASKGVADVAENSAELVIGKRAMNFKGGETVLNGQDTKKLLGKKKTGDIYVYVTIEGNVIGNEEYADYMANKTASKILEVLPNV